jgi:hypothetical protein
MNVAVPHRHRRQRIRFLRVAVLAALTYICLIPSAKSQSVQIQVSDYHERPIEGAILSGKAAGTSTSPPTDLAGKTQIIPPPGAQPGDPLPLTLVKAPSPKMIIMSPFEGLATIPKSPWYVEVILGEPGDTWALKDERVVSTWALTLLDLYMVEQTPEANLSRVASVSGFTPEEIDHAIHTLYDNTHDITRRALAHEYERVYHPHQVTK